jgi:hypothetical protein
MIYELKKSQQKIPHGNKSEKGKIQKQMRKKYTK